MPTYSKAVFMSIRPKWCYKIFSGEKTLEIRKSRPCLNPPFDVYVYCTAPKERTHCGAITISNDELYVHPIKGLKYGSSILLMGEDNTSKDNFLNGKCIGKLTIDYVQRLREVENGLVDVIDAKQSCLTAKEIIEYSNGHPLYGWHIKEAELFKHPFTAEDFPTFKRIMHPPQSWRYIMIVESELNNKKGESNA